jgi:hypothetical protein
MISENLGRWLQVYSSVKSTISRDSGLKRSEELNSSAQTRFKASSVESARTRSIAAATKFLLPFYVKVSAYNGANATFHRRSQEDKVVYMSLVFPSIFIGKGGPLTESSKSRERLGIVGNWICSR